MLYPLHGKAFPNQPIVTKYQKYRIYCRDFVHEIVEEVADKKSLQKTAQIMGVWQSNRVRLKAESEMKFVMDCLLFEYETKGKKTFTLYQEQHPELEPIAVEILGAMAHNFMSLYRVIQVDRSAAIVTLKDLLHESAEQVELLDIALSQTASIGVLLFTRLLPFADFNMTSGMYAVFPADTDKMLIKRHQVLMQRVKSPHESVKQLVAFFKLNRAEGILVGGRS
jgi:hypothetical protein